MCMGSSAVTTPTALAATEPKLNLLDISILARKVKVARSVLLAHDKVLQTTRALYPIKRSIIKIFNLPNSQNIFFIDNVQTGQMPSKMILGIVTNNEFSGSYLLNPYKFNHHNLFSGSKCK